MVVPVAMNAQLQRVAVLGSTGSIGLSTLDVLARHPERFRLAGIAANQNVDGMLAQIRAHSPGFAVAATADAAARLQTLVAQEGHRTRVLGGAAAVAELAASDEVDTVVAGVVGAVGLASSLAAARAGKRILLANKEALVMAGALFMAEVRHSGAVLLPIDSEHNAIFQCLPLIRQTEGQAGAEVVRILLTASGGPFRCTPRDLLRGVTPDQACAHPNWRMGRKISVDSATMMNKGLELIEACWLFDVPPSRVEIVVHPESIVHSMVEYADGSVLAQMGQPDMRTPIAHALGWPDRIASGVPALDLLARAQLNFEAPDPERFPCLLLARQAADAGGTAAAILNAANEEAVAAFLAGQVGFMDIPAIIAAALSDTPSTPASSLEVVHEADRAGRAAARKLILRRAV